MHLYSIDSNKGYSRWSAITACFNMLWSCLQVHSQHVDGPQAKSASAASEAAKVLMDEALGRKSADNITVLVICINWD